MYWNGFSSSWPFSHTWIHETAPTYPADELFQPAELTYDWCRPYHCQSDVHGCWLSATEFSCCRFPHLGRPAAPHHVRIISACFPKLCEDAPLPAFFFVTFVQCLQSDSCHYWHSDRPFYLLTYLLEKGPCIKLTCFYFVLRCWYLDLVDDRLLWIDSRLATLNAYKLTTSSRQVLHTFVEYPRHPAGLAVFEVFTRLVFVCLKCGIACWFCGIWRHFSNACDMNKI